MMNDEFRECIYRLPFTISLPLKIKLHKMSPTILATLTIFIIGIISFLIGWWLTTTKWKGNFFRAEQNRKNVERRNRKLEASLKKTQEVEQEHRNRIQLINADVKVLEREVKNYKREQQSSKNEALISPATGAKYNFLMNELNLEKKNNIKLKKQIEKLRKDLLTNSQSMDKKMKASLDSTIKKTLKLSPESIEENHSYSNNDLTVALGAIVERISIFSNVEHKDDLSQVKGIDESIAGKLNQYGIYSFKQLAMLKKEDIDILCTALQIQKDLPLSEKWVAQANQLYYKKYG